MKINKKIKVLILCFLLLAVALVAVLIYLKSIHYQADTTSTNYDVVVIGAGSGGISAAVQAARLGSKVALIEESGEIGGQLLSVSTMDEGGDEAKYGIYKEFRDAAKKYYDLQGKGFSTCYWSGNSACIEPHVAKVILNNLINNSNFASSGGKIDLLLNTKISRVVKSGVAVTGVITTSGRTINSFVTIDATEYGDIIPLTGANYRISNVVKPSSSNGTCIQDITYPIVIKKYPSGVPASLLITSEPPGYQTAKLEFAKTVTKTGLSEYHGSLPVNFEVHNQYRGLPDSSTSGSDNPVTKTAINWANDFVGGCAGGSCNPSTNLSGKYLASLTFRATSNCQAKLKTLQFLYYIQHDLGEPNWSFADDETFTATTSASSCGSTWSKIDSYNTYFPPYPYIRESARLIGVKTLTGKDIKRSGSPARAEVSFDSSVAVGYYPTDLHNCNTAASLESSLEQLSDITPSSIRGPFQIPIEAFVPKTINGFLVAEKNISQSRIASSATRLQPATMLTGQAVGVLASLSAKTKIQPRNIKVLQVQKTLAENHFRISLSDYSDVPIDNEIWPAVQIASTYKILNGSSTTIFGAGQTMNRGQAAAMVSRLLGLPAYTGTQIFKDVDASNPFYKEINQLYASKLISGCSSSPLMYCPNDTVTRAQISSILVNGLKIADATTKITYTDVTTTHWAYNRIEAIGTFKYQIVPDCDINDKTKFCPERALTYNEAALISANALYYLKLYK